MTEWVGAEKETGCLVELSEQAAGWEWSRVWIGLRDKLYRRNNCCRMKLEAVLA
jgi:hypothetical protein